MIIFSSDKYFSEKCGWALILRMSARARRQKRKMRHPSEAQLLPARPGKRQPRPVELQVRRPHLRHRRLRRVHLVTSQPSCLRAPLLRLVEIQIHPQEMPVLLLLKIHRLQRWVHPRHRHHRLLLHQQRRKHQHLRLLMHRRVRPQRLPRQT